MVIDRLGNRLCNSGRPPAIMGILNVTPDSFSDGGLYERPEQAVRHALGMIEEGAEIIDVGAESTRPGSQGVVAEEQIRRAIPVIKRLRDTDDSVVISIDTRNADVAEAALAVGADMVNDVSALRDDPRMVDIVAGSGARVVLMHRRGDAATMQSGGGPRYDDVVVEIAAFLAARTDWAEARGVYRDRIILDPGIGFGKRVEHNLLILRDLDRFVALGRPVLVGASRKRFLGRSLDLEIPADRDTASFACAALAARAGAAILRVHAVRGSVEAAHVGWTVRTADTGVPHDVTP